MAETTATDSAPGSVARDAQHLRASWSLRPRSPLQRTARQPLQRRPKLLRSRTSRDRVVEQRRSDRRRPGERPTERRADDRGVRGRNRARCGGGAGATPRSTAVPRRRRRAALSIRLRNDGPERIAAGPHPGADAGAGRCTIPAGQCRWRGRRWWSTRSMARASSRTCRRKSRSRLVGSSKPKRQRRSPDVGSFPRPTVRARSSAAALIGATGPRSPRRNQRRRHRGTPPTIADPSASADAEVRRGCGNRGAGADDPLDVPATARSGRRRRSVLPRSVALTAVARAPSVGATPIWEGLPGRDSSSDLLRVRQRGCAARAYFANVLAPSARAGCRCR